jgi:hypothetical protein
MSILKDLQRALRTVRPPCKTCPYRLGIVKFVQSPCPMCMMNGYRTYDDLTRPRVNFPGIWRDGMFRDGVDDGKIFRR